MNVAAYWRLRFSGFDADVAKALKGSQIPLSTARKIGPKRLATLDDLATLEKAEEAMKTGEPKSLLQYVNAKLEELAGGRARFSIQELVQLVFAKHNSTTVPITLEDVAGYEAASLTKPDEMLAAYMKGLNGSSISHYLAVGVTSIDDMATLASGTLTASAYKGFVAAGVQDIGRMVELTRNFGVHYELFKGYIQEGITEPRVMMALNLGGVNPKGVRNYRIAHFENPEDMILLRSRRISPAAVQMFAMYGFGGKGMEVIKLLGAGMTVKTDDGDNVPDEDMRGYAFAGFGGNIGAMIALHDAGVPGGFARACVAFLNGTKLDDKLELAKVVISAYNGESVQPSKPV